MKYNQIKQLNHQLIEKGYNAKKRKEIIQQTIERKKTNKKKKKQRGMFTLPHNWMHTNITASIPRQSCLCKLKLKYPLWKNWHQYLKMTTIPIWASGFAVCDGSVWITAQDMANKLHRKLEDVIYEYLLKLQHMPKFHEIHPTYFKYLTYSQRENMPWLCMQDIQRINQMKIWEHDMRWHNLYDNSIKLEKLLQTKPWCHTIHNSNIFGQGDLHTLLPLILHAEACYENTENRNIHISTHNTVTLNDTILYLEGNIKPTTYKSLSYPKQYLKLFNGRC